MSTGNTPPVDSPVVDPGRKITLPWQAWTSRISRLLEDVRTVVADLPAQSIPAGTSITATVTAPRLNVGDIVAASFDGAPGGLLIGGSITAAGTAAVTILNVSGADVALPAGKIRLRATKAE